MKNLFLILALQLLSVGIGAQVVTHQGPEQRQQQSHMRRIELPAWPTPLQGNCVIKDLGVNDTEVNVSTFQSITEKGYTYNPSYQDGLNLGFGCQTTSTTSDGQLYVMDYGNCAVEIKEADYTLYVGAVIIKNAYYLDQPIIKNELLQNLPYCIH